MENFGDAEDIGSGVGDDESDRVDFGDFGDIVDWVGDVEDIGGAVGDVEDISGAVGDVEDIGGADDHGDYGERSNYTEFLVEEAMTRLPNISEVSIELRPCDVDETGMVQQFMQRGCGCRKWDGKPCSQQFLIDYVKNTRLAFMDLSSTELDLLVMGQLLATTNTTNLTIHSLDWRHQTEVRQKRYSNHYHQGNTICAVVFRFLHGIGIKRLKNISLAMKLGGVGPRVHGNTGRLPRWTLSLSSVEYVVRFLLNPLAVRHI